MQQSQKEDGNRLAEAELVINPEQGCIKLAPSSGPLVYQMSDHQNYCVNKWNSWNMLECLFRYRFQGTSHITSHYRWKQQQPLSLPLLPLGSIGHLGQGLAKQICRFWHQSYRYISIAFGLAPANYLLEHQTHMQSNTWPYSKSANLVILVSAHTVYCMAWKQQQAIHQDAHTNPLKWYRFKCAGWISLSIICLKISEHIPCVYICIYIYTLPR